MRFILLVCCVFFITGCEFGHAQIVIDVPRLMEAIYRAEGGERAKKPYGVLSVPCEGKAHCGRICENSIRNNLKRYAKQGLKGDSRHFIAFMGKRYAPDIKGLKNDPTGLNSNWVRNVTAIYNKNKRG